MSAPVVSPHADPWLDLVHHTLAYLPVTPQDASSLHSERYMDWAEAKLPRAQDPRRTLPEDAERLAALYDATPGAHRLGSFAGLHRDLEAFLHSARFALSEPGWPDEQERAQVRALADELDSDLVELFRIALWGEAQAGYVTLHKTLGSQVRAAASSLSEELRRLQTNRLCLGDADWRLSHPLGRSGRLVWDPQTQARRIIVGVVDPALGVPAWAPLLQGVHELLLSEVQLAIDHGVQEPSRDTRCDRSGWGGFFESELMALCLDCRVHRNQATAAPLRQWLARFYPAGEADLAPQLAAAGIKPRQPCRKDADGFVTWLATGAVLPRSLEPAFAGLLRRLGLED